ncbi:MAG: protein kinase domain-containing protein [Pyrinomonadaceae bacterium]
MTPERWQEIEAVLQGALDRPPMERASFLDEACAGDEELKEEANSLISAYDDAGDFIEQPAIAQDARVLVGDEVDGNIGREIGPYKIVERLGAGGMGEVYLAQDARLNRLVALKILPPYFASDDARLRRFQSEARAASALNHPNILTIHEVGESEEFRFIATEFIDGQTIRELIAKGDLRVEKILDISEQVAFALSAAHAAGIVHRDIKPENIMRRTDGLVKILDFGIAKLMEQQTPGHSHRTQSSASGLTEAGVVMGTVDYMSPEQARGLMVDERTDVWSLGVLLYEMLTRRKPFAAATRIDIMVGILEREPRPLHESTHQSAEEIEPLQRILDKALRKERGERYQTAGEMLADLKSVREQVSHGFSVKSSSVPQGSHQTLEKLVKASTRRHVWPALSIAVLLIALTAGTIVYRRSAAGPQVNVSDGTAATIASKPNGPYSGMSEGEQLAFVDVQANRISTIMGDRPVKLNDEALRAIKRHVDRYVALNGTGKPEAERLSDMYARATPYVPLIARSFAARKVPVIIGIYLPMIESAYRNCYENSFGAKGLYQFLPQTAKQYGVAHEDMCDVEKMTPAAAQYIADHMADLGDDAESMTLVLLSHNTGAEWVKSTLRGLRETDHYERNFWTLLANREELNKSFQNEGAAYVPRFFAAAIIGENPQMFNLPMPALSTLANPEP